MMAPVPAFGCPLRDTYVWLSLRGCGCLHTSVVPENSLGRPLVINSSWPFSEAVDRGRRRQRAVLPPDGAAPARSGEVRCTHFMPVLAPLGIALTLTHPSIFSQPPLIPKLTRNTQSWQPSRNSTLALPLPGTSAYAAEGLSLPPSLTIRCTRPVLSCASPSSSGT